MDSRVGYVWKRYYHLKMPKIIPFIKMKNKYGLFKIFKLPKIIAIK